MYNRTMTPQAYSNSTVVKSAESPRFWKEWRLEQKEPLSKDTLESQGVVVPRECSDSEENPNSLRQLGIENYLI